jgi:hypothetical protein
MKLLRVVKKIEKFVSKVEVASANGNRNFASINAENEACMSQQFFKNLKRGFWPKITSLFTTS